MVTGGLASGVVGTIAMTNLHYEHDLGAATTAFGAAATSLAGGVLLGIDNDVAYAATESYIQSLSREELEQLSDELNSIEEMSVDNKQLVLK